MPQEIAVIVVISIIAGTFLGFVKAILGYLSAKNQVAPASDRRKRTRSSTSSDASLTTSELHALIRTAVEDANAPLLARIEALEEEQLHLPAPHSAMLDLSEENAFEPVQRRRRTSS